MLAFLPDLVNWLNENQAFVMVVLTFVYVVLTFVYVLATVVLVLLSHWQERNRTRPFVIFDLTTRQLWISATLRNVGQRAAREVTINVSPSLKCVVNNSEIPFIRDVVPIMSPGHVITALLGSWKDFEARYSSLRFEGSISYKDSEGNTYREKLLIDLNPEKGLLIECTQTIEDVAKNLERISGTMEQIAKQQKQFFEKNT